MRPWVKVTAVRTNQDICRHSGWDKHNLVAEDEQSCRFPLYEDNLNQEDFDGATFEEGSYLFPIRSRMSSFPGSGNSKIIKVTNDEGIIDWR